MDVSSVQETSDEGAGMDRCIVSVQKPLSCSHLGAFLLENRQEPPEDLRHVVGVYFGSDGSEMLINASVGVKEGKYHLLLS